MKKMKYLAYSAAFSLIAAAPAFSEEASGSSAGVDLSPLVSAVDFSSVITALLGVAAATVGVLLAMKGISWVKSAIRKA